MSTFIDNKISLCLNYFSGTARKLIRSTFRSFGPVWLTNVTCTGEEASVFDCAHSGWNKTNCSHGQDVYITCNARKDILDDNYVLIDPTGTPSV